MSRRRAPTACPSALIPETAAPEAAPLSPAESSAAQTVPDTPWPEAPLPPPALRHPRLRWAAAIALGSLLLGCALILGLRAALREAVRARPTLADGPLRPGAGTAALTPAQRAQLEQRYRALDAARPPVPDAPSRPIPRAPDAAPPTPPAGPPQVGDMAGYAARYGAPAAYARSAHQPRGAARLDARGLLLRARLRQQVACGPWSSPVVAVLTQPAQVAGVRLEVGTELDGSTAPGEAPAPGRVALVLTQARLADGRRFRLEGTAQDGQGRPGLAARPAPPEARVWRGRAWSQLVQAAGAQASGHLPPALRGSLTPLLEASLPAPPEAPALWLLERGQRLRICVHSFDPSDTPPVGRGVRRPNAAAAGAPGRAGPAP